VLPPCGLYKTTRAIGDAVPTGRLVYFHNHGQPGPGIYLPKAWRLNQAQWHDHGTTIPDESWAQSLEKLPAEGFYRVTSSFFCCDKKCREFEPEMLLQLGYNGLAEPILFAPEWTERGLAVPERGTGTSLSALGKLVPLKVTAAPTVAQSAGHLH
jgi:hypothetical protein